MEIALPSGTCKRIINEKTIIVDDFEYTLLGTQWSKVRELSTDELSSLSLYDCHASQDTIIEYAQWVPVYRAIGFAVVLSSIIVFYQLIKKVL